MKKSLAVFLLISILILSACSPQLTAAPATVRASQPAPTTSPQPTMAAIPTARETPVGSISYSNSSFGLWFQFPANWFGPEEYVADRTLRVEVGSDKVYPYGSPPDQPSEVKNSYNVVMQYTKNNQNPFWKDTYQSLQNLKDGESITGTRSLVTRVRQLNLGRFTGFEYVFTLPEGAGTEHAYGREVMLFDEQTNDLLTITGQPNNVEVSSGAKWRDIYSRVDEANLTSFHDIVDSLIIE